MSFPDYLVVTYKNQLAPPSYARVFSGDNSRTMESQLRLINGIPIEIESNGSFYNPRDLLSIGYWAWSEKIARMLPFDYRPGK
jgi:hypothetical protein